MLRIQITDIPLGFEITYHLNKLILILCFKIYLKALNIYTYIHVFMYAMTRSWLGDDIHIAAVVSNVYTFRYKHGDMCTYENMKQTIMLIEAITSGLHLWLSN